MKLAGRMSRIGAESAFDVLTRARALEAKGRDVIHLEIGEPDFPTPQHIVQAGKKALDDGWTHYGPSQGYPEFREAIAQHVSVTRGIPIDPANVCVTPGAKPIMFFTMLALLGPGDEVVYPNPGFPIYESMINVCGATPAPYAGPQSFTQRTKMLVLNSPENPTGKIISPEAMAAIADEVRKRDIIVLSDEIYSRIYYGNDKPLSLASLPGMLEKTIILDGFSKTYAMTGWRLGYGIFPPFLVDPINKLMVNSNSCTASFTQIAGIAALRGTQEPVTKMVEEFRRRRDAFCAGLNDIPGWHCELPGGAFYAWAKVPSNDLADRLLNEAGVACLNGKGFGAHGEGYIRFSYANSYENLMRAIERIKAFYGAL